MALQTSGTISIGDLRNEFGDTGSSSLSEFYRGGSLVPDTATNAGVPTSGTISLSYFYGASAAVPSYAFTAGSYSVTEGDSVTVYVNTTNVYDGTTLYWTISNGSTSNDDFSSMSDSFSIYSNSGSFSISATFDGSYSESNETATLYLRTDSTSGNIEDSASLTVVNVGGPTVSSGTTSYLTDIQAITSGATLVAKGRTYVDVSFSSSTITVTLSASNEGNGSFTSSTTNGGSSVTAYTISAPGSNLTHYKLVATSASTPTDSGQGSIVGPNTGGSISDNTWYSSSGDAYIEVGAEIDNSISGTHLTDWIVGVDVYYRDSFNNEVNAGSVTVAVQTYVDNT